MEKLMVFVLVIITMVMFAGCGEEKEYVSDTNEVEFDTIHEDVIYEDIIHEDIIYAEESH